MNIHQAARKIVAMPELPAIEEAGICYVLHKVADSAFAQGEAISSPAQYCRGSSYTEVAPFLQDTVGNADYLPERGVWTEQRLNAIALLAVSDPEDFL